MIPEYFGHDLSDHECDELAHETVDASLFKGESALLKSKWFDYRFIHPLKATAWFLHEYKEAHTWTMQRRFDYRVVRPGFRKHDNPFTDLPSREVQALWRARQHVDRLGMPYDVFCMSAMVLAEQNMWPALPRPNQFRMAEITDFAVERWNTIKTDQVRLPYDSTYQKLSSVPNNETLHDFKLYLAELAYLRKMKYWYVGQLIHDGRITQHEAVDLFGTELAQQGMSVSRKLALENSVTPDYNATVQS